MLALMELINRFVTMIVVKAMIQNGKIVAIRAKFQIAKLDIVK